MSNRLNLPVITADDTLAVLGLNQTYTGTLTINGGLAGSTVILNSWYEQTL